MKNRNSLVFALCAMLGIAGLTACGDDGRQEQEPGDKVGTLIVDPTSVTLTQGEDKEIKASYLKNTVLTVSTNSKDCVSISSEDVNTGETGVATIIVTAEGSGCDADITISVADKKQKVSVTVGSDKVPFLKLSREEVELDLDGQDTVFAQYIFDDDKSKVKNKDISLSSSNENCVKVDSSVKTDDGGNADIVLTAADGATAGCSAFITVTPPEGAAKNITAKVVESEQPAIDGDPTLEFTPSSMTMDYVDRGKGDFKVTFKDGKNNPINGYKLTFSVTDDSCIKLANAGKKTVEGIAENSFQMKKAGCKADVIVKAGTVADAKMPVTINALSTYNMKLALKYEESESRFDGIGYVAYKVAQDSCDALLETYKAYDLYIESQTSDDSTDTLASNKNNSILHTFDIEGVDVEMDKSIVAWGAKDDFGAVTAVGCVDLSAENAGSTVTVNLSSLPLNISGSYDIIGNFDLTSAFPTSSKSLPAVENMVAGDWVNFVVDLFKKPVESLLNFVWANTVSRLKAVADSSDNSTVKGIINFITSDTTKDIAVKSLTPLIENYLKNEKEGQQNWFTILTTISGDIEELVRNMQFSGTIKIDANESDKTQLTGSEEFKTLEYQWNFVANGQQQKCMDTYAREGSCRSSMSLSTYKVDAIKSNENWNGELLNVEDTEGVLKINSHSLTFKWATILYSAVFGEILPKALGYSGSKFVNKNGETGYRYITGFLNALIFEPIAKYYKNEKAGKPKDEGDGTYPQLSITEADKDCERFIETLVYLIYSDASSLAGAISVLANLACGDQGLGQLDKLVADSLAKIESSTENVANLSVDACKLYTECPATVKPEECTGLDYEKLGKPDKEVYTANEVVQGGKQSMRCDWQISLPSKVSDKPIKGVFHGERQH